MFALNFQHVLEHGKPHERSAIVKQLTGQIVQMSQQKFASNVIEKCLTFGTLTERQLLVNERHQYGALISLSGMVSCLSIKIKVNPRKTKVDTVR